MTNAPFETVKHDIHGVLIDTRIPVYPHPSIFATTIAYSNLFGDEFGHEAGLIDAATVAEILAQPPWTPETIRAVVQQRMDATLRAGWGAKTDGGRDHYWFPVVVAGGDWRSVGSACMRHGGKVGREGSLVLTEEPINAPCGSCVKRLNMREVKEEHS